MLFSFIILYGKETDNMALKPDQLLAIEFLAQPGNAGHTVEQVAKECGVSRKTIYEWKKKPEFEAELKRQIKRNLLNRVPDVMEAMIQASITEGNAAAAKLVVQAAEMLTDNIVMETKDNGKDVEELKRRIAEYKATAITKDKAVEDVE
jgi:L-serine deaminase